jgi:hypothetical protein
MPHGSAKEDPDFRLQIEACQFPIKAFDHQAHLRLAYVYLTEHSTDTAYILMRNTLLSLLEHHGIDSLKYHETMTRAWLMAIRHFMENTPDSTSATNFIAKNPRLLDTTIMMTHYSPDVLFSNEARTVFIGPDLDPIPSYVR